MSGGIVVVLAGGTVVVVACGVSVTSISTVAVARTTLVKVTDVVPEVVVGEAVLADEPRIRDVLEGSVGLQGDRAEGRLLGDLNVLASGHTKSLPSTPGAPTVSVVSTVVE